MLLVKVTRIFAMTQLFMLYLMYLCSVLLWFRLLMCFTIYALKWNLASLKEQNYEFNYYSLESLARYIFEDIYYACTFTHNIYLYASNINQKNKKFSCIICKVFFSFTTFANLLLSFNILYLPNNKYTRFTESQSRIRKRKAMQENNLCLIHSTSFFSFFFSLFLFF